jgi:hypothetical protein
MLLALRMPKVGELMTNGQLRNALPAPGTRIGPGTSMVEVRVDLSYRTTLDCPPIYYFRVVAREAAVVLKTEHKTSELVDVGEILAWLGTNPDEALRSKPDRDFRVASVGIQVDPVFG